LQYTAEERAMKQDKTDPLIESLMGLAVAAAPLIRRARESGIFRAEPADEPVEASVVRETPAPKPAAQPTPDVSALEALIGRQAMRIAELEAEVAALKAAARAATTPAAKAPARRKKPGPRKPK
jgi:hypothetical protein